MKYIQLNSFVCLVMLSIVTFSLQANSFSKVPMFENTGLPDPVVDSDFYNNGVFNDAKVALGKHLFYEKELSGNRNISCASCHHFLTDTGDGLSLPIGEGGTGLGVTRNTGAGADAIHERVPRNAPPLFNLGAKSFTKMFHDGRVEVDVNQSSGFSTPAGNDLPLTLENVLAAQAMFPVTSGTEMAGQAGENAIADAAHAGNLAGPNGVWQLLADRLRNIPEYVYMFNQVYGISAEQITFAHAANAIAEYEAAACRADNSPFDHFLRGDKLALTISQFKGLKLFYGKAKCANCHSGKFQTDMQFHAIAIPQIGPGKGDGFDGHEDYGRERVTANPADRYRFRTPTLRNVALTAPYGHDGAYDTLQAVVEHHLKTTESVMAYDCNRDPVLVSRPDLDALDCLVQNDNSRVQELLQANQLPSVELNDNEIKQLVDFLHALTDKNMIDMRYGVPKYLPSGLNLAE
ncbi:MAG: cytochrome-c peroxidase [Gammaproteobacteria bacterium]|nr:cytochrome-c peroxidase [Gammaproteobacteria bacterium]MDH5727920.1 cytochrome-c peroxidase [Gammaproteobacteria bacterium]